MAFAPCEVAALIRGLPRVAEVPNPAIERMADGFSAAFRQLHSTVVSRSAAPLRSALRKGLLDLAAAGCALRRRQDEGRATGRQIVAVRTAFARLGGYGRRALADAAAGPGPLHRGEEAVASTFSAIDAVVDIPSVDATAAVAHLVEWANAAAAAHAAPQPRAERLDDAVRRFAFAVLLVFEQTSGHTLRLARRTYDTDDWDAGTPYGPAIALLDAVFAHVRGSAAAAGSPEFEHFLQPSCETLATWIRASRGEKWTGNERRRKLG